MDIFAQRVQCGSISEAPPAWEDAILSLAVAGVLVSTVASSVATIDAENLEWLQVTICRQLSLSLLV